jgi:hypothetical protein
MMARQPLDKSLYDATVEAFIDMGMPQHLVQPAAEVIATDSAAGTSDNPTERTPDQQAVVSAAWNWANDNGKLGEGT